MKPLVYAFLILASGVAHAGEVSCASAVTASVEFMTATYGVRASDVSVQVVSVNKSKTTPLLVANVLAGVDNHQCALSFHPASPRPYSLAICEWSISTVDCDSAEVLKKSIVNEPALIRNNAEPVAIQNMTRGVLSKSSKSTDETVNQPNK